jgi:glycosyltransferase domain-containing protein
MAGQATAGDLLTVLIPTRNRPHNLPGQLRLLRRSEFPLMIADSSDAESAARIRDLSRGLARFQPFPSAMGFFDKLVEAVATIRTPYTLLASDRKITFLHAAETGLARLQDDDRCVAVQGYIVGFGTHESVIDINRIVFFTPTIGESDPLQRHYHLMRRYQSWQFSVFRTGALLTAARQAQSVRGITFQEVMFMNAMALQGRMIRLPEILSLQTIEQSFSALADIDPFYWFMNDSRSFQRHYLHYRNALAWFISERGIAAAPGTDLIQLLDTVSAVWLRYSFDSDILAHAARLLRGDPLPPLPHPRPTPPWREVGDCDVVHPRAKRTYIWRSELLNAEPKDEIRITAEEIGRVEQELDLYFDD